jgi:hypothetical protein
MDKKTDNINKKNIDIVKPAATSPVTIAISTKSKTSNITAASADPHIIVNPEVEKFAKYPIKHKKIKSSLLHFNYFYKISKLRTKILYAVIIGLITAFISVTFVQNTGLYTGGTSAFFQGFARMIFTTLEKNIPNNHKGNIVVYNMIY